MEQQTPRDTDILRNLLMFKWGIDTLKLKLCDVPRGQEIEKPHVQMGQRHPEKSSCSQFHQHFTRAFFANILSPKNYEAKIKQRKAVRSTFVRKCTCKMLMKLIPDVQK